MNGVNSFWEELKAAAGAMAFILAAGTSLAQEPAMAAAPPVLTIYEETAPDPDSPRWVLDIDALKALPAESIVTSTIWTTGRQRFTGVRLDALLSHFEIDTGVLTLLAVNDYLVEIPVDDITADGPLIAYEWNGKAMTVRDKGPLWLVYPYDSDSAYRTETIYSQSIWQLDRMIVSR